MGSLRDDVQKLAKANPGLRKHLLPLLRKEATQTAYFAVDARSVLFWTKFNLKGSQWSSLPAVLRHLKEASDTLQKVARAAYSGKTPSARSLAESVQMGLHVAIHKDPETLAVFTEFLKEGRDRTSGEWDEMAIYLRQFAKSGRLVTR